MNWFVINLFWVIFVASVTIILISQGFIVLAFFLIILMGIVDMILPRDEEKGAEEMSFKRMFISDLREQLDFLLEIRKGCFNDKKDRIDAFFEELIKKFKESKKIRK